jgi:pyruvate/2-oxoglutarate dehydrogenase complex dihydrolipoamide dehydrogenase (E3) component
MVHIANLLYVAQHVDQFGRHILAAKVEWSAVMAGVDRVINHIRGGTSDEAAEKLAQQGIDVILGEAAFVSPHELIIADRSVNAEHIIIAIGSQNVVPSVEGLSNVEAVALPALPRSLAVEQGRLAARNAFAGEPLPFNDRAIP